MWRERDKLAYELELLKILNIPEDPAPPIPSPADLIVQAKQDHNKYTSWVADIHWKNRHRKSISAESFRKRKKRWKKDCSKFRRRSQGCSKSAIKKYMLECDSEDYGLMDQYQFTRVSIPSVKRTAYYDKECWGIIAVHAPNTHPFEMAKRYRPNRATLLRAQSKDALLMPSYIDESEEKNKKLQKKIREVYPLMRVLGDESDDLSWLMIPIQIEMKFVTQGLLQHRLRRRRTHRGMRIVCESEPIEQVYLRVRRLPDVFSAAVKYDAKQRTKIEDISKHKIDKVKEFLTRSEHGQKYMDMIENEEQKDQSEDEEMEPSNMDCEWQWSEISLYPFHKKRSSKTIIPAHLRPYDIEHCSQISQLIWEQTIGEEWQGSEHPMDYTDRQWANLRERQRIRFRRYVYRRPSPYKDDVRGHLDRFKFEMMTPVWQCGGKSTLDLYRLTDCPFSPLICEVIAEYSGFSHSSSVSMVGSVNFVIPPDVPADLLVPLLSHCGNELKHRSNEIFNEHRLAPRGISNGHWNRLKMSHEYADGSVARMRIRECRDRMGRKNRVFPVYLKNSTHSNTKRVPMDDKQKDVILLSDPQFYDIKVSDERRVMMNKHFDLVKVASHKNADCESKEWEDDSDQMLSDESNSSSYMDPALRFDSFFSDSDSSFG